MPEPRVQLSKRKAQLLAGIATRREVLAQAVGDSLRPLRPIDEACRFWFSIPAGERQALRSAIPRLLGAIWRPGTWSRRLSLVVVMWRLLQMGRRHARDGATAT